MNQPNVEVLASELETHASSVGDCLKVVNDAQGASKHVKLGNDAYGLLCQWLPPILSGKHDTFDSLLSKAEKILEQDATNLRIASADFTQVDTANGAAVDKVGEGLWGE